MSVQSVSSSAPTGLGYLGSQYLKREKDGIHSYERRPTKAGSEPVSRPFMTLLNYPCSVLITKAAADRISWEFHTVDNPSNIRISAMSVTGQRVDIFAINPHFFGSVASHMEQSSVTPQLFSVNTLSYDSSDHSFAMPVLRQRASLLQDHPTITQVTHFVASYVLGSPGFPATQRVYDFTVRPNAEMPVEQLTLYMDFEGDAWKLQMWQPTFKA